MNSWQTMEYCTKCREHHLFDEQGQVDKCKDYKRPLINFESIVKDIATELTRRSQDGRKITIQNKQ
jgi:hypothetical protein